jgi:hypothetical protein
MKISGYTLEIEKSPSEVGIVLELPVDSKEEVEVGTALELPVDAEKKVELAKLKKKAYRFSSKSGMLTYSRCGLTIDFVNSHMQELLSPFDLIDLVVSKESHSLDDSAVSKAKYIFHYHVYFKVKRKLDIKNPRYFDIPSEVLGERNYHPNTKSNIKNHSHIVHYVLKDHSGNLDDASKVMISDGLRIRLSPQGILLSNDHIMLKLIREGKIDDAMSMQERLHPKTILNKHMQLEKSFRDLYMKSLGYKSKFTLDDFIVSPVLTNLLDKALIEQKTLFIMGKPGSGKTRFMMAYCESKCIKPLIVNNIDALKLIQEDHGMIVFDDVDFSNSSREELISLLDAEKSSDIRILYQTLQLPANLPRTILSNAAPAEVFGRFAPKGEVTRRFLFLNLGEASLKPVGAIVSEEALVEYRLDSSIPAVKERDCLPLIGLSDENDEKK